MHLSIDRISKRYKNGVWGLKNFSLELRLGILGLLGPNGAGKSTLMSILATVTKPTEGTIQWDDTDVLRRPDILRSVLGYLPQNFGVYPNLNAVEFLQYLAAVKGLKKQNARKRISELLEVVNLTEARKQPLGTFSGGMRQRVGIAQALLSDPQLLIVDEPTAGLDPEERVRFRNLLSELSRNRIIILSTHIVPDVESITNAIALIAKGSLVTVSAPEDLLRKVEGKVWHSVVSSAELSNVKASYLVSSTLQRADGVHIRVVSDSAPPGATSLPPSLEDAYLYLLSQHKRTTVE